MTFPACIVVTFALVKRCCQSFLNRPTAFQSLQQTLMGDALSTRPFCKTQRYSIMCQPTRDGSVLLLFLRSCPSDIARFVIAVIVDSIKRVTRTRRTPNIIKKGLVIIPTFRHANTACTVTVKQLMRRCLTACAHVLPGAPFARPCAVYCFAVTAAGHGRDFI